MSNVNIIVAIDEDAVLAAGQYSYNPSQAKQVDNKFIHMLNYNGVLVTDHGGTTLTLNSISAGREIQWTTISLSPGNSALSTALTSFAPSNIVQSAAYLSKSELITGEKVVPIIKDGGNGSIQIEPELVDYQYWHSSILKSPMPSYEMEYYVYFTIFKDAAAIGYSKYKHKLVLKVTS
ncbi:inclusion body family protein [Xenorhabdus bovienii]|uniref:AidA/PixA family protein n=1 Tax=Xenorhabdus bovienii TaxID=40576 RepID=UPI00237C98FE|nr:AidA/PixA family protein [Xenorhabdus bovienii]MDE1497231.1 inclusion body family protein [Xenorhabdus bovienii]MDE9475249.1 inclusion body family protein [Xenorhabdus bovienii]